MATSNEAEKARHALRRRRRLRQVLGAVVCVLVVIGLASVISGGVRLTASLFDDTEEKEEFELRLQTLVSLDPEPFDSLESANRARLLDAAIWSVIQQNSDSLDTYERDEVGAMYLPTLDIDRAVASLYGPDFHFNYETFTDNGLTFQYVPEKNAYLLPITSVNGNYSPARRQHQARDRRLSGPVRQRRDRVRPHQAGTGEIYGLYLYEKRRRVLPDSHYRKRDESREPDGFRLFRWSAGACCPAGPGDG